MGLKEQYPQIILSQNESDAIGLALRGLKNKGDQSKITISGDESRSFTIHSDGQIDIIKSESLIDGFTGKRYN